LCGLYKSFSKSHPFFDGFLTGARHLILFTREQDEYGNPVMHHNHARLHTYFSDAANLDRLLRFVRRRIGDPQLADDVMQETILRSYEFFDNDDLAVEPERLDGFISKTSDFMIRRTWSSQKRATREVVLEESDFAAEDRYDALLEWDALTTMAATYPGWAKASPKHRRWGMLHGLHGLSFAEIAEMEQASTDAVRKALYRLRTGPRRAS
jgi:DNA-directed RNA polymerase specialized sigma24 family protein